MATTTTTTSGAAVNGTTNGSASDRALLQELDALVRETHLLWDQEWVGFSWRNYTFEHMQRVRALAGKLAREEGADGRIVEFASTLHDVTKSYDGEIIVGPDGKRVLDENGFWKNDTLQPSRENAVTRLFAQLGLGGTLHNVSGGIVANALLRERGFVEADTARIDQAIREHLMAGESASLEGKVLYDSDTIDANIGLPAFYRNIQISLRGQDRQYEKRGESFMEWLQENLPAYLDSYLKERIPTWIEGKHKDFVPKMTTPAGRRAAEQRLERLRQINADLVAELDGLEHALEHGRLAVLRYFMENRKNPEFTQQVALLEQRWSGEATVHTPVQLLRHIREEVEGAV